MKNFRITFVLLFITLATMAQSGIVLQGIARDNNAAAISNRTMTFTFRITKSNGSDLYKETKQIRTDNFGVFSHVIGTGNAVTGVFSRVDFAEQDLKAVVSINKDGDKIQIYDQKFEYVPYAVRAKTAKNADDGSPVGTVVAFLGNRAPEGWIMCHGQYIKDAKYAKLRAVLGNSNRVPDLRGRFVKGAGISSNIPRNQYDEVGVRVYQNQSIMRHNHYFDRRFYTSLNGEHTHRYTNPHIGRYRGLSSDSNGSAVEYPRADGGTTTKSGNHRHTVHVHGHTHHEGSEENRPWSYTANYIIKY